MKLVSESAYWTPAKISFDWKSKNVQKNLNAYSRVRKDRAANLILFEKLKNPPTNFETKVPTTHLFSLHSYLVP